MDFVPDLNSSVHIRAQKHSEQPLHLQKPALEWSTGFLWKTAVCVVYSGWLPQGYDNAIPLLRSRSVFYRTRIDTKSPRKSKEAEVKTVRSECESARAYPRLTEGEHANWLFSPAPEQQREWQQRRIRKSRPHYNVKCCEHAAVPDSQQTLADKREWLYNWDNRWRDGAWLVHDKGRLVWVSGQ